MHCQIVDCHPLFPEDRGLQLLLQVHSYTVGSARRKNEDGYVKTADWDYPANI